MTMRSASYWIVDSIVSLLLRSFSSHTVYYTFIESEILTEDSAEQTRRIYVYVFRRQKIHSRRKGGKKRP